VNQSSLNFFRPTQEETLSSNSFPTLDIFIQSGDIRAQSGKGSEIEPKLACLNKQQ